jgi:fructose-1,6-bisphosphatase/inositol monophosphatase family enzyme
MDEKIKNLVKEMADKVEKKVREEKKMNFEKFGNYLYKGADGTPTQYVDKIAEDVILGILKKSEMAVNVLSEESGFIDFGGDLLIVIDPIDGTRNACRGIPFYCVSIAVGKKSLSDVEFGLVKNIPTGDTYLAEKGKGSFLNGKRIKVNDGSPTIISPVLGRSGNEITWKLVKKNNIRAMGSAALEMCLVASGSTDAYFMGKELLRSTDIAASSLIVRESGGEVFNANGRILDMDLNLDERSSVLALASRKFLEEFI